MRPYMQKTQTFAGHFAEIRPICQFILEGAEAAGFDQKTHFHLELACDEACTNIIEHSYGGEGKGDIVASWHIDDVDFRIELQNTGQPFEPETIGKPELVDGGVSAESVTVGGLGMHFMRTLMDDVVYTFNDGVNSVVMRKRLPNTQVAVGPVSVSPLQDNVQLVTIRGRLDQSLIPMLEQTLAPLLEMQTPQLILDLSETSYINSGGLRTLVAGWRKARQAQGDLVLAGLNENITEIIAMVGFDQIFHIRPTAQEALQLFTPQL